MIHDETQFAFNGLIESRKALLIALEVISNPGMQKKLRRTLANIEFRMSVLVGEPPPEYTLHYMEQKETWRISYLVKGVSYNLMNNSGTNHRYFYTKHKALLCAWKHYEGQQDESLEGEKI